MLVQAKGLPDEPLDEIAADSVPDDPRRHGQPEASKIPGIGTGKDGKERISRPPCLLVNDVELALVLETLRRGQAAGSSLRFGRWNERRKRVRR